MNKCSRFLAGLLTAGLIFSLGTVSSKAAEQEGPYGYQVTFYAKSGYFCRCSRHTGIR